MDKSKYFLDLSKCTEEERKSLPQIIKKANEDIYEMSEKMLNSGILIDEDGDDSYILLSKSLKNEWIAYLKSGCDAKKELTYPEFIKLFEGGEAENGGWISSEIKPDKFQDVILYREDAGVFTGYYGNLAESLSEMAVEQLYKEGVSEETMWQEQFFYFGIEGHGILELDTEPTHWMPLPDSPKF